MMEAWFNSSEMIASSAPSSVSNRPPLASKHDEYKMVSKPSAPSRRNDVSADSSSLCWVWVPQMNRTDAIPKPHLSRASFAASISTGESARPR